MEMVLYLELKIYENLDSTERELVNANDKVNFLNGKSPSIVYLWDKADEHDLLASVCQQLSVDSSFDSTSTDSVGDNASRNKQKRKRNDGIQEKPDHQLASIKETMDTANEVNARSNLLSERANILVEQQMRMHQRMSIMTLISSHEGKLYDLEDRIDNETNDTRKMLRFQKRADETEQKIASLKRELDAISNMTS